MKEECARRAAVSDGDRCGLQNRFPVATPDVVPAISSAVRGTPNRVSGSPPRRQLFVARSVVAVLRRAGLPEVTPAHRARDEKPSLGRSFSEEMSDGREGAHSVEIAVVRQLRFVAFGIDHTEKSERFVRSRAKLMPG